VRRRLGARFDIRLALYHSERLDQQTPTFREYLVIRIISVCSDFSRLRYRCGTHRRATTLLYDPARIEPRTWLAEHLGVVVLLDPAEVEAEESVADKHAGPAAGAFVKRRIEHGSGQRREPVRAGVRRHDFGDPMTGAAQDAPSRLGAVGVYPAPAFGATPASDGPVGLGGVDVHPPEATTLPARLPTSQVETGETPHAAEPTSRAWEEFDEERAAIIEFDGGIPRHWAEAFARFDPDRPPADVPLRRWRQFVDDAGGFLASPFRAAAEEIGWRPQELLGGPVDRAPVDQGLLWLLNGAKLVMLATDTATIETPAGVRHTLRRKPVELEGAQRWERLP